MLGRLCMSIDDAIEEFIRLERKVFVHPNPNPPYYNATALEDHWKEIVARYTSNNNKDENMLDLHENSPCKA